ncbi:uncharacterized protein LOC143020222 [Oratosquilla oratoria]|uniref:uncharacterized protein LOC143020222 n=1 Tax=Oratosquilla oratoria TaxID=337810 RepID=UPI003F75ADAB
MSTRKRHQLLPRVIDNLNNELPVPKTDYVKLVSLCVKIGVFMFNGREFKQHRGLTMGSPPSAVLVCLFMEILEVDEYIRMMDTGTTWLRYVDDVIVIIPENANIEHKLNRNNKDIQFTVEMEADRKLPFLDKLVHRRDGGVRFSVYRKPTD